VEAGGGGAEGAVSGVGGFYDGVGFFGGGVQLGEVAVKVAEGCDGGAVAGADVDVGEEGVEGAGVGKGAGAGAEEGCLAGCCGEEDAAAAE
jgi:hypothetical protein